MNGGQDNPCGSNSKGGYRGQEMERNISAVEDRPFLCQKMDLSITEIRKTLGG